MKLAFAAAIVALTLPVLSLADITNATATLTANMTLNLDAGTTGTTGGDLLWNGTTLTPQGSATAGVLPGVSGASLYGSLNQTALMAFSSFLSNAAISAPAANAIIAVHTNGGNWAKILVNSDSSGSLGIQYTTYGATGGGGGSNAPSITDVQNAASNTPSSLPNGAIAQGSMFVVKGSNLGPATFIKQTGFPFTKSVGGTSITVTVGGATVDVIMYYSLAGQVAGILPSKTNTGTGTLKLTYNGQSATASITVVKNNVGIYTLSSSGSGDAIAFLNSDYQLITPTHAANAGDVIAIWGTGLGALNLDETVAVSTVTGGNQAVDAPLHVYIGGKEANIGFQGRNGCCTSVDSIYVTVPDGITGCAVSVLLQIGNTVSNATSIAIADNGRTCTAINPTVPVGFTGGTYRVGGISLGRIVENSGSTSVKADDAGASFEKITITGTPSGSQLDVNGASYGSCRVYNYQQGTTPPVNFSNLTSLDAGPSIGVMGPGSFGNKTLQKSTLGNLITYSAEFDQTATTLVPGTYTFTGPGGADVGQFSTTYTLPDTLFTWTDQSSITTVNRANPFTVHWTGGNPSGYVTISGTSASFGGTSGTTVVVSFVCTARVSDQMFTVPPVVLLALPPSTSITPGGPITAGTLDVETSDYQLFGPPPGLDAAVVASFFSYGTSVTYQ